MDVLKIRKDFPYLDNMINGKLPVYFDSAATTQKPRQVIDTITKVYSDYTAPVNRSAHSRSSLANTMYREAHRRVADFIGASNFREIIFTKNSTEAINIVCGSLVDCDEEWLRLAEGDEIIITQLEHHSNSVPWMRLTKKYGVKVKTAHLSPQGLVEPAGISSLVTSKTKLICCTHVSNVTGAINPVEDIAEIAHKAGALFFVDGTQSVPHIPVDVKKIGCDFFTFSGHKMLGPAGTGVLWGKEYLLEMMPPFMSGGGMIQDLTEDSFVWEALPWKFEAGTPDLCGAVALAGADVPGKGEHLTGAVDYLNQIGMNNIRTHTISLCAYAIEKMSGISDLIIYGPPEPEKRCGIISFNIIKEGVLADSHMVSSFFDDEGIALRAGGHCAYPLMRALGVKGTTRISLYIYNTYDEIDYFISILKEIIDNRII